MKSIKIKLKNKLEKSFIEIQTRGVKMNWKKMFLNLSAFLKSSIKLEKFPKNSDLL